jgi:hypothetical protein
MEFAILRVASYFWGDANNVSVIDGKKTSVKEVVKVGPQEQAVLNGVAS